ncbi:MAG: bifunctional aspartate kinase/homoserine dehydrogenase I, partial [Bacteroidetes bacterium]|nr:bifunctional aspartate kinase/homoserine dehydrogenase I [Bacteroidota bacterium]
VIVVVSAFGGITDLLHLYAQQAAAQTETYAKTLELISSKTLENLDFWNADSQTREAVSLIENRLSALCQQLFDQELNLDEVQDEILIAGEAVSSRVLSGFLNHLGMPNVLKDSSDFIVAAHEGRRVRVDYPLTYAKIKPLREAANLLVMPGFMAKTKEGKLTTLGRGGSDFSAALVANGVDAEQFYIYTDVSGIYTADPHFVKQAKPIKRLSYEEALELSHFGAKVLYAPSVQPAFEKNIPLYVKNTFDSAAEGTYISSSELITEQDTVMGISHLSSISLITVEGADLIGQMGFTTRFFETLSTHHINVILITQASSEYSLCIAIDTADAEKAQRALNQRFELEISTGRMKPVRIESGLSIVALVGEHMKSHTGVSGKLFSSLGANNINIIAIAQGSSERNISFVIDEKNVKKALNTIHERFFEKQRKQINLFVVGVGTVGSRLLNILQLQRQHLLDRLSIDIRIVGLSNSKKMAFNENGHDLSDWKSHLEKGQAAALPELVQTIQSLNLRNSILIDNTASHEVSDLYLELLQQGVGVVTCNKIACSSALKNYKALQKASIDQKVPFYYETNVGAGLPIIDTLKNLIDSGDSIRSIVAVLSGSLNFIFDTYNATTSFKEVVEAAMSGGYTEPDPRIDLSGLDVKRKLLILARESGFELELDTIQTAAFLPDGALETPNVEAFLSLLEANEQHFASLYQEAKAKQQKLKFVAELSVGADQHIKAKVGLQGVGSSSDYYTLSGSDNILMLYTDRYQKQPMVIKGAGAGADVTASGIFGDIIRASNHR